MTKTCRKLSLKDKVILEYYVDIIKDRFDHGHIRVGIEYHAELLRSNGFHVEFAPREIFYDSVGNRFSSMAVDGTGYIVSWDK